MRLFLSSQDFGTYPEVLVSLVGDKKRVAFINNAKDETPAYERSAHTKEKKIEFERLGFTFEEIDLRQYFGLPQELLDKLSNFSLIWAAGGNTFVLRRAMAASGLDDALKELLKDDKIVYGGSSAGSIVATPSLRGTEFGDDPKIVPKGYDKKIIWDGLKLVPFYIVPHYKSDWFGKQAEEMATYMQNKKLPYYALIDNQVVLVDGQKEKMLK